MTGTSFASRVAILLGLLITLACAVVATLNYLKFEKLLLRQQSRVIEIVATDVAEAFERGVNLGVRLQGVPGGQSLLERALTKDADIRRISVSDARGHVLFDSDRGRIGADLPLELRTAPPDGARTLRANAEGLAWVGVPIVNGFGQVEGTLLVGHARATVSARLNAIALEMLAPTLAVLAVAVPLVVLATFLLSGPVRTYFDGLTRTIAREPVRARPTPTLAALDDGLGATERLLADAEAELERVMTLPPDRAA